jgi:acyl-coenzyme A synthetase/AMP-(fatty) acid ligase
VATKKGATLNAAQMIAELKLTLAGFKVPKAIHFVDELPRNTMGKVQKKVLRDTYR